MIVVDIVIGFLLLVALFTGFRKGFFVQLAGLAGLVIGVWLAIRSAGTLGMWLGINDKYAAVAGFLIILVVVILLVASVGRVFRGVFGFAGLSLVDKLAGMVLSLAKTGLIVALVLWGFDATNRCYGWVPEEKLDRSVFYRPMLDITTTVFPYIESLQDTFSPLWRPNQKNDGQGHNTASNA